MATEKYRYIDPQGASWSIEVYDVEQEPYKKRAIGRSFLYSDASDSVVSTVTGDDFVDAVTNINKFQFENSKDKIRLNKENRFYSEYSGSGKKQETIQDKNDDEWHVYKIDYVNDGPIGYYAGKPSSKGFTRLEKQENAEKKYPYEGVSIGPAKSLVDLYKDVKKYVDNLSEFRTGDSGPVTYDIDPDSYKEYAVEERKKEESSLFYKISIVAAVSAGLYLVIKGASK